MSAQQPKVKKEEEYEQAQNTIDQEKYYLSIIFLICNGGYLQPSLSFDCGVWFSFKKSKMGCVKIKNKNKN